MDLYVHFGKTAFIVLYLLYICILGFQINIFNSIQFNTGSPPLCAACPLKFVGSATKLLLSTLCLQLCP